MQLPAFGRLWASDTASVFGAEITTVALPLAAVLLLDAGPPEMAVLVACELLPYALLSLPAGAWVDRWPKKPLLLGAAWSRCALLLAVPAATALGMLNIGLLCVLAFLLSAHAVFVDLAYQALLPQIVERDELVRANARLGLTQSAAGIAGPGLAGLMVQAIGAPLALLADAIAMAASGLLLRGLRVVEPAAAPAGAPIWREMTEGLRLVAAHPGLRRTVVAAAGWQFLKQAFQAVLLLFAVRELALEAGRVGAVMAMAGVGFGLASLTLPALERRIGLERTMCAGLAALALGWLAASAVRGPAAAWGLGAAILVEGLGAGWLCLAVVSLRQAASPPHCLARVIAGCRVLTLSAAPCGALLGGALAQAFGLRPAIAVLGGAGLLLAGALQWAARAALLTAPTPAAGRGSG